MRHLIVTRLQIGVARPSAFLLHAHLLVETALPGLAAQTDRDFHWVVVTDAMIAPRAERLIARRFAPHPHFHLEKIDAFGRGGLSPDVAALCDKLLGTTKDVITSRLDDDDALRTDFVARTKAAIGGAIAEGAELVSFSHARGVALVSTMTRHAPILSKHGPSAGMSLFSRDARRAHVHDFGHNAIHEKIARRGGVAIHLEDDAPHFLSGVDFSSDSREKRDVEKARRRIEERYIVSDPADPDYAAMLARFALPPDFDARIHAIRKKYRDPRPPLLGFAPGFDRPPSRLTLKGHYLAMARPIREQLAKAVGEDRLALERQLHLIRQAFYMV